MGPPRIHPEAARQEGLVTYTVISYPGILLPASYIGLVYSKWKRSLRYGNDYFRLITPESYYAAYDAYITKILRSANAVVRLAVLSDDHDVALGFAVTRGSILDYVHVQKDMRRYGIGTKLVPAEITTITHLTRTGLSIWGSKFKDWKFNPFA